MLRFILILAVVLAGVGTLSPRSARTAEQTLTMSDSHADRAPGDIDVPALRERRKQAQMDLNTVREFLASNGVAGAVGEAQQEHQALLEQIVRGYDEQLSDVQRLAEARQRHADVVRGSSEWKGFPEASPYSIFLADQLWDTVHSLKLAAEGLQSQRELLTLRFEQAREALTITEERLRQASEQLETVKDSGQEAHERREYELAARRARAASVLLEAAQLSIRRVEEELDGTRAQLAFEERRLGAVSPHVTFSKTDLERILIRLAEERVHLETQLQQTLSERQRLSQVVLKAERRLDLHRRKQPAGKEEPPASARAKMEVELVQARKDNLATQGDLLQRGSR